MSGAKDGGGSLAKEILSGAPKLINSKKETPQADPFLIAAALQTSDERRSLIERNEVIIVTEEGKFDLSKIPKVAERHGLKSVNFVEMCEREKWKYD